MKFGGNTSLQLYYNRPLSPVPPFIFCILPEEPSYEAIVATSDYRMPNFLFIGNSSYAVHRKFERKVEQKILTKTCTIKVHRKINAYLKFLEC